ncbi:MAG: hypothetical protein GX413_04385 [Acetobacter sp.]|nr:hypothetical protein [Acetobacter sp.]
MNDRKLSSTLWLQRDGSPVSCEGKLRVLQDNWQELSSILTDTVEDATLMGVDPDHLQNMLTELLQKTTRHGLSQYS